MKKPFLKECQFFFEKPFRKECQFQVHYQNDVLATEFIYIIQPEYSEWGTNDDWLYQKIATKLALGSLTNPNISNSTN